MSFERWKIAKAEPVPCERRQHVPPRYARGGRFAGVDGHITYGRQSSEHERPDRGRRVGPRRGARTRPLPESSLELRSGVGLTHSTDEVAEGNEARGGKG